MWLSIGTAGSRTSLAPAERANRFCARGYPAMDKSTRTILIVEKGSLPSLELRRALERACFKVHVVNSFARAILLVRTKRIDGAVIDRSALGKARVLCDELVKRGIPFLFHGAQGERAQGENVLTAISALTGPGPSTPRFFQQV